MTGQKKLMNLVRLLLGVLGGALLTGGIWFLWDTLSFMSAAVETTGTVVEARAAGEAPKYTAVLAYTDTAGVAQTGETHLAGSGYNHAPGTELAIYYDPAAPGTVRLDEPFLFWGLPAVFIVAGIANIVAMNVLRKRIRD